MRVYRPSLTRWLTVLSASVLLWTGMAEAQTLRSPQPGEVYKEFTRIMRTGSKEWRVTDPDASAAGSPGNSPADFLPNPVLPFQIDDLKNAVRAEAVIDYWGGHPGTTGQKFRFNGNPWITVPELATTPPGRAECYVQQWNVVVDVPLEDLISGQNVVEGTADRQTCYNFNWGQWGWYMVTVRVYYDPAAKSHPTGAITSPTTDGTIGEHPQITATAESAVGIDRIEVLAYYDGYDTDGDGVFEQYHHSYHRLESDTEMLIQNHVGTVSAEPYEIVWNTDLVPDQPAGTIKLLARIRDTDGLWYVTDEVGGLTLERMGSVRLYKPQDVGERFWTRSSRRNLTSSVTIPEGVDLTDAISAKLFVKTWNGIDGGAEPGQIHYTRVNSWTAPEYGANHYYSYDVLDVPPAELINGHNTLRFSSESTHHGVEILWPGPAVLVRYAGVAPAFCGDGNQDPGEECDDGNNGEGDGCEADCTIGEVRFLKSPQPGEVYREFSRIMATGSPEWRVTDPGATAAGSPGNSPADFLPNPQLPLDVSTLEGAVRAEALIDLWGGHVGTADKKLRFNDNDWIAIPELTTTPTEGQCYTQQLNVVVEVPLEHLVAGTNILEGTAGRQTCYSFNWGQYGWYAITLRVYYDPGLLPHPTGTITSPSPGAVLGEDPTVTVDASGPNGVDRVELFAYYEGYDTDGDGIFLDWHQSYHREKSSTTNDLSEHVGTDSEGPYEFVWDTELVPNQLPGIVKLVARIRDTAGVWSVTDEVEGLSLLRTEDGVKLYVAYDMPERAWVRTNRQDMTTRIEIPEEDPVDNVTSVNLMVKTWNGEDAGQVHWTRLNNWNAPGYGANHFYSYDVLDVPTTVIRSGINNVRFHSESTHHGIEVLWPGPGLVVRYGEGLPYCGDGLLLGDEECDDGNNDPDDGCGPSCATEFCGDSVVQESLGEACDDGNAVDDDDCGNDCLSNLCGDGEVTGGEQCDDANLDDVDDCGNDCLLNYCGDGEINNGDLCDDGNAVDDDACGNDCLFNYCGDGQKNNGELCDDGNATFGDGCESDCMATVLLTVDRSDDQVLLSWTADAVTHGVFRSDDPAGVDLPGNNLGTSLAPSWLDAPPVGLFYYQVTRFCGNGELDADEECDDGNFVDDDDCSLSCTTNAFCGDGVVNADDECDDGNNVDGDGCQANCLLPVCGDGILDPDEECDDANNVDGDGCKADCTIPEDYKLTFFFNGEGCHTSTCNAAAGYTLDPTLEHSAGDTTAAFHSSGKVNTSAAIFGNYGFDAATMFDQMIYDIEGGDLMKSDAGSVCMVVRRAATPAAGGFRLLLAQAPSASSYVMLEFAGTDDLQLNYREADGTVRNINTGSWNGAATDEALLIQVSYDSTVLSAGLNITVDGVSRATSVIGVGALGALAELKVGNSSSADGDYHFDQVLVSERSDLDCWDLLAGTCSTTTTERCLEDADCPGAESCVGVVETYDQID